MPVHPEFIFRGEYTIGSYDIDSKKRLTIPALTKMMHEAAMQNVLKLNLSYWDLIPHKVSWVLMRKKMEIFRQPLLGEKVIVETHPAGFQKLFTYRDFKVFDEKNNLVASASSTWLLMDTETRKMAPIPQFILEHEIPELDFLKHPAKKIPAVDNPEFQKEYTVGWFELDWNEHLNNIHYLVKMLEVLPLETHQEKSLKRMDLIYKLECKYGDVLLSEAQKDSHQDFVFQHRIINKLSGKEVALGRSYWE